MPNTRSYLIPTSRIRLARAAWGALATLLMVLGCSGSDATAPPAPVATVSFGTSIDGVVIGQTHQLSVTTSDASGRSLAGRNITWSVQDTTVAAVNGAGLANGLKLGTTQVTAVSEGVSASITLLVRTIPVARIAFDVATEALNVGDSAIAKTTLTDASGAELTGRAVLYSSSSPSVLGVAADGKVKALTPGTSIVTATSEGRSANLTAVVRSLPVARIILTPATLDFTPGTSGTLTVRTLDVNGNAATPTATVFKSSDPTVATFQSSGRFVAVAPGKGVLTVTSDGVTGSAPITVESLQPGTFHFDLRFVGPPDADVMAAAQAAAARWERVLPAALTSQTVSLAAGACETLAPAITGTTTGIIVTIAKDSIDGRSRTLAEAGPCVMRTGGGFPAIGAVDVDSADVAAMVRNGTLTNVITHELGHVLGIGTLWQDGTRHQLLTDTAGTDPRFIGAAAIHAAVDIGFLRSDSARGVEVENIGREGSRLGHWRESVYSTELMTSVDGPGPVAPLSRITVSSLTDLGYVTRDAGADFFSAPTATTGGLSVASGVSASLAIPVRREQSELLRRPRFIATPSGRTVPLQ